MYHLETLTFKKAKSSVSEKSRTDELAKTLYRSMGYKEALQQARQSNWHAVADAIHFLAGQSVRRF